MPMKLSAVLSLMLLAVIPYAKAQRIGWDTKDLQVVSQPIGSLSVQDQKGIASRLGVKPEDLLAMRVKAASGHIFLVQSVYSPMWCGVASNCAFWVLSSDYKVLLSKVTQRYALQASMHHGYPDILTYMHSSATEGDLSYWQYQGTRYVRVACADAEYEDAGGNVYKKPHISPHSCGRGG
jgi:hypothetical protein